MARFKYYKERVWNRRICKICGVTYVPHGEFHRVLKLCYVHRHEFIKVLYQKNKDYSKKNFWKYKDSWYLLWKEWAAKYPSRRREIALKSYHLRKDDPKNKQRKHRRTKPLELKNSPAPVLLLPPPSLPPELE